MNCSTDDFKELINKQCHGYTQLVTSPIRIVRTLSHKMNCLSLTKGVLTNQISTIQCYTSQIITFIFRRLYAQLGCFSHPKKNKEHFYSYNSTTFTLLIDELD